MLIGLARRARALSPGSGPIAHIERLESRQFLSVSTLPRPDHVVVLVEEDHSYTSILGDSLLPPSLWSVVPPDGITNAGYLRDLAARGASFTNSDALGQRSATNYQGLFSGINPPQKDEGRLV